MMLQKHRAANPDGPYQRAECAHPTETPSGRWDCPQARVDQLRREARQTVEFVRAWIAQQRQQDLVWHWQLVAECESGGNWSINTGNGYYGGLQFSLSTWRGVGGTGYPHHHSAYEQARRADMLRVSSGLHHWPVCGSRYR